MAQVRSGDIPLPLGTGLSPSRSLRELLLNCFGILPSSQGSIHSGPLDEQLRYSTVLALMKKALQNSFGYL
jgi:hypothetical protein